jgi:hypothetical protein
MIPRNLHTPLLAAAGQMPAVAVLGPRQSGKTTLCRAAFPQHAYVSREALDHRDYATSDPRGFLARYGSGVMALFGDKRHVLERISRPPSRQTALTPNRPHAKPPSRQTALTPNRRLAKPPSLQTALTPETAP